MVLNQVENPEMTQDHEAAVSFPALPEPVLIYILKKVPQRDRLSRAALVCKTWAAAAIAASTVITLTRLNDATASGLSSWLQQHGSGAVEAIQVPTMPHEQVQLKLPNAGLAKLQFLHLQNCALEFSTSSASNSTDTTISTSSAVQDSPPIVLPALRRLYLNKCKEPLNTVSQLECPKLTALQLFPSAPQNPLAALQALQEGPATEQQLEAALSNILQLFPAERQQQHDTALSTILQKLPELVFLGLVHEVSDAGLEQLSCLQHLKQCSLGCPQATTDVLSNLASGLTSFSIMSGRGVLQERNLPAAGWPHLQELKVSHLPMQPAMLSRLTALEQLSLTDCVLVPYPNRIQPTPQPYDIREAKEGAAQLLAALAHLTNLRKLDLTNILLETLPTDGISNGAPQPGATAAAAPAAEAAAIRPSPFSALTASSVLESLVLAYRSVEVDKPVQPLPTGAVAALLPPGRQLTALTELVLDGMDPDLVADLAEDGDSDLEQDPYNVDDTCMRDADFPLLLDACPGLQRLTLNSVLPRWCHQLFMFLMRVQDRMQQLTYLSLGGLCLMDDEAPAIASIRRLRELELHNAPEFGPDGLAHLTELYQLTRLLLRGIGHRRCLGCEMISDSRTHQPPVWRQLVSELPDLREQQWEMKGGYDSEDRDSYETDDGDAYTDSSDSDGCVGRRGAMGTGCRHGLW